MGFAWTPLSFADRTAIEAEANKRLERDYVAGKAVYGAYVPRTRTDGRAALVDRVASVGHALICIGATGYLAVQSIPPPPAPLPHWPALAFLGVMSAFLLAFAAAAIGSLRRNERERRRAARWHLWRLDGRTLHVTDTEGRERILSIDQVGFDEFTDDSTRERISLCTLAPDASRRALVLGQLALVNRTALPSPAGRRLSMRLVFVWPAVAVALATVIPPTGTVWLAGLLPGSLSISLGVLRLWRSRGFARELPGLTTRGLELIRDARRTQRA